MKTVTLFLKIFIVMLTAMSFLAVGGANGEWIYQENPDEQHPNNSHPLLGFYYFVTYYKPTGAVAARWLVKHGNLAPYDFDIPSACWNEDPTKLVLRLYSNSNNGHGGAESWPECFDGTNWVQVGNMTNEVYGGSGTNSTPQLMTDSDWDTYSVWNEIGPTRSSWQTSYTKEAPRWYEEAILWWLVEKEVAIDIKPGSDPNCFNINGHGVIPVAILGSSDLDVSDINVDSLSFGGLKVRVRGNKGPLSSIEYSNDDEFFDLVCHFEDDPQNWTPNNDTAEVTGELLDGTPIRGTDSICIVP